MKSIRLLAECMQGFERHTSEAIRACELTPPQFDIIATLGNTQGMSYKMLGEKTLITKGTLTGIIERLEQKGLVERERSSTDKRSFFVRLTPSGEAAFDSAFPKVVAHGKEIFAHYTDAELGDLDAQLQKLKDRIQAIKRQDPQHDEEPEC